MLRAVVVLFGVGLVCLAVVLAAASGSLFPAVAPAGLGLIILAGTVFERFRYRKIERDRPGADWVETGERFIDPETNEPVTVYQRPRTGERRYVRGNG